MNAFATKFFLRQIARRLTTIEKCQVVTPSVIIHYKETGIDLLAWREIECHMSVFLHTTVVPMPQVGFEENIRQFMMEWCQKQYVITGSTTAAGGVITSLYETVVVSSFTGCRSLLDVSIVTVVLDLLCKYHLQNVCTTRT